VSVFVSSRFRRDLDGSGRVFTNSSRHVLQRKAWIRRQKILNRGEKGIELITGSRDSVAADSAKEFQKEEGTEESAHSAERSPGKVEAKWEKKWNEAAEKAPVQNLENLQKLAQAENEEASAVQEIRQRKKAQEGEEKEVSKKAPGASEMNQDQMASMQALRAKLHQDSWGVREFWLRQLLIVGMATFLAIQLFQNGNVMIVSENDADREGKSHEADSGEVSWNDEEEQAIVDLRMVNSFQAPYGGFMSIPVLLFILRVFLHSFVSMAFNVPFSLGATTRYPPSRHPEREKGGLLSKMLMSVPQLQSAVEMSQIFRALFDDIVLFSIIFVFFITVISLVNKG